LDQILSKDRWDDAIWEKSEERGAAFVLVIRRDGTVVADRVFADLLNRGLSGIVSLDGTSFVAAGAAHGDRGWLLGFRVSGTRSAN
jgi:hypothetical protein